MYLAPAGSYEATGWGLHDMVGNVQEWVQDCIPSTDKSDIAKATQDVPQALAELPAGCIGSA